MRLRFPSMQFMLQVIITMAIVGFVLKAVPQLQGIREYIAL